MKNYFNVCMFIDKYDNLIPAYRDYDNGVWKSLGDFIILDLGEYIPLVTIKISDDITEIRKGLYDE